MARYFMSGTRLGWVEKMMMSPARPSTSRVAPRQKGRQKKLPCNRPVKPRPVEQELEEGSV